MSPRVYLLAFLGLVGISFFGYQVIHYVWGNPWHLAAEISLDNPPLSQFPKKQKTSLVVKKGKSTARKTQSASITPQVQKEVGALPLAQAVTSVISPAAPPPVSPVIPSDKAGHLLIGEVFVNMGGTDTGEFVELYNPTDQAVSLGSWSLQYLSGSASSTQAIVKKNFIDNATIGPKKFYLVGMGDYAGVVPADMKWSQGLNNKGGTIFLVRSREKIVNGDDPNVVDHVGYGAGTLLLSEGVAAPLPPVGWSIERRAWQSGFCVSALGSGELLGNSCDTNNNAGDFEIRAVSNPQNSQSLPEVF